MNRRLLSILVVIFFCAIPSFAQTVQKNLLEKTELNFTLYGEPTSQDVGFDNPKSSWKIKYELFLTDFSELEKLGICRKDEEGRHICAIVRDKKTNNKIKKKSSKLFAGNFVRKSLSSDSNRNVIVPINLTPNVIEVFNQAKKSPEKNPTFVLFVTEKVSIKTPANIKFKQKNSMTGINNLKNAMSNRNFDYWDVSCLSVSSVITKQENNRLRFSSNPIRSGCSTN